MQGLAKRFGVALLVSLGLLVASSAPAQDLATRKLVTEATRLRESIDTPGTDLKKATLDRQDRSSGFNDALRDWIESRIPKSKAALDTEAFTLQGRWNIELSQAHVHAPAGGTDNPGYVGRLEVSRPQSFPEALTVVAGTTIPCGTSDAAYVYDYSSGLPRRVLESSSTEGQESVSDVYFSPPDISGARLILALRRAVLCGSSGNGFSFNLFRYRTGTSATASIFSGEHGNTLGAERPYKIELTPDELLMELHDRSIDSRIPARTHILRYSVGPSTVKRIDPVALQPQDFVDEWLTRPWSEMESRSASASRDKLAKWHNFLSGDFVSGAIDIVQPCAETPDHWKVAVRFQWAAGRELPEQFTLYFLVHGLGNDRFEMAAISFNPPDGCPGQSPPNPAAAGAPPAAPN